MSRTAVPPCKRPRGRKLFDQYISFWGSQRVWKGIVVAVCCLGLLGFSHADAQAQDRTDEVRGTVTDAEEGTPLPGVNVRIKGTDAGTTTNADGEYAANVDAASDTLVFSYVGYQTEEVAVNNREVIDVQMTSDVQELEGLVVVGYGMQEERDVTGAIEKVDSERFNRGVNTSPDRLIAGKVAGVSITSNSGEPGGQNTIRIRGGTSINASNDPLFVIDGVPIDNSANSSRNPLNFLNPNDVESMTVLKDASAAAIYGSRGANGVVLITTKQGEAGQPSRISYSGWMAASRPIEKTDVLSADEFREAVSEKAPSRLDRLGNAETDWQEEVLRSAVGQNHNLSLSGSTEDIQYRASLNFMLEEGIIKTSNTDRISASVNYTHHLLNDNLVVTANVRGARTKDRFSPGGIVGNSLSFAPTQPVYDPDSEWAGFWEWNEDLGTKNPVAEYELTGSYGNTFRSVGDVNFDYTVPFAEGLSAEMNLGYDVTSGENKFFAPSNLRSQYSNEGEITRNNFEKVNTLFDAYLNYSTNVGSSNSSIELLGGYSYQQFNEEYPEFRAWRLSNDLLGFNSTAPANETETSVFAVENRLISFFGRVNYDYDNKYLLTATLRRDGSSRFGPENRWGLFPSGSVAWRISEEPFFGDLRDVISDLKFRLGGGITGNQEIGDFQYLPTYTFGDNQVQYQFGDNFVTTVRPNGVDPTLKWEETSSYNIGADYELLDGRVNGSLEYYYKKTEDLLFTVTVPAGSNLTNRILTNIGALENEGVEFEIDGFVFDREDLSWNLGFNVATNRNEVLKLTNFDDPDFEGFETGGISGGVGNQIQILREGESAYAFHVYHHKTDSDGTPLTDGEDHNGDGEVNDLDIYEDVNGDGVINEQDRAPYRSPAPDVTLGFTSNLYYKNLDLSFTLRGSIGNDVYNNVASNFGTYARITSNIVPTNMHRSVLDYNFDDPQYFSDVYVEDGSYLKLDNFTVGYTFGSLFEQMQSLRVYATGENLLTLSGYSGLEPEVEQGIDNNVYPRSRRFILGVSIDF